MSATAAQLISWCQALVDPDQHQPRLRLEDYLKAIPRLASLADLPAGTSVLIRGDVDAKPGGKIGEGDIRLRSMLPTLRFGQKRGWKQIIFGHIGRKPEGTLKAVVQRLGELLDTKVELVSDWWDEAATIGNAGGRGCNSRRGAGQHPGARQYAPLQDRARPVGRHDRGCAEAGRAARAFADQLAAGVGRSM